jgi:DNA-binding CsgD family transcriptional regulator
LSYVRLVTRFTSKQVQDALALIYVAHPAGSPAHLVDQVIEALVRMVPGELVGYNERELMSHDLLASAVAPSVSVSRDVVRAVTEFCAEYPLSMEQHHTEVRALRISDFASPRQLHRLDYYDQALKPLGIEHQIRFWVGAPNGIARFYYISRRKEDGDFTDGDRDMLQLLRPFLVALHERFDSETPESAGADGLTNRETEILGWVARGKTNQEIAALLIVSPHTVRKHLEHVYEKLRVNSRTAAVARAFAPLN